MSPYSYGISSIYALSDICQSTSKELLKFHPFGGRIRNSTKDSTVPYVSMYRRDN